MEKDMFDKIHQREKLQLVYVLWTLIMGAVAGKSSDEVEAIVCQENEMKDGEMRVVEIGDVGRALLIREGKEFHAIGTECSHYKAPLIKGALCEGRVRCPWHGACFNIKTGDIEDFPGLDGIPKYKVEVNDGQVKVRGNRAMLKAGRLPGVSPCAAVKPHATYLIIGGGGAAATCVEALRKEGFNGRIIMTTKEDCRPYDRPKLSKAMESSAESLALRKPDTYKQLRVEVWTNMEATAIDTAAKNVSFADGSNVHYDKVMLATGGRPQVLNIPGADLKNIFYLRTPADGNAISKSCRGKSAVVIGTSFIGLEVAAFMVGKASSITVVGRSEVPLKNVLGEKIGMVIRNHLEDKGVKFVFANPPAEFIGKNGALSHVKLSDGSQLPADICVLGVGVTPNTDYLKGSGVELLSSGHVIVNKQMKSSSNDVYAAGDIVQFPLFMAEDQLCNIQHWQMAGMHGSVAGSNMAGKSVDIHSVPFFWTAIAGKNLRFAGHNAGYDDIIIDGDLDAYKFIAFYTKRDSMGWVERLVSKMSVL
ncbi:hypothetical protein CAPTEDRAFT_220923 [Capitella teleta]|uniref:Rieske domain-containing protein n=1 Tax=Capitella teleta TaxID=283909 RepID=R7TYR8_CAPTE|nr:hypothetical protein CAPTEDRAFT_220923 [Capitella teleta]|eukprot:ELT98767.1 hypothetical protein CAPTEDRAFT_220923 [Capitella teleta]